MHGHSLRCGNGWVGSPALGVVASALEVGVGREAWSAEEG